MPDKHHTHPNYLLVWIVLCALTTLSILTSIILNPRHHIEFRYLAAFILFALAGIKAVLIALNFMHLRFEKILIVCAVLVPLTLLIIAFFGFMPDAIVTLKR
jgi:caa(3)-type oxidase subunit IV